MILGFKLFSSEPILYSKYHRSSHRIYRIATDKDTFLSLGNLSIQGHHPLNQLNWANYLEKEKKLFLLKGIISAEIEIL